MKTIPQMLVLARAAGVQTNSWHVGNLAEEVGRALTRVSGVKVTLTSQRQGLSVDVVVHSRAGRWLWSAYGLLPDLESIQAELQEARTVQVRLDALSEAEELAA